VPELDLPRVLWEARAIITALEGEVEGAINSQRARAVALDHARTVVLLLQGSASDNIKAHPKDSTHHHA
jgi:hypothetical protein